MFLSFNVYYLILKLCLYIVIPNFREKNNKLLVLMIIKIIKLSLKLRIYAI